jgi:hypothetical protein
MAGERRHVTVMFRDLADSTGRRAKAALELARSAVRYPKASFTGLG